MSLKALCEGIDDALRIMDAERDTHRAQRRVRQAHVGAMRDAALGAEVATALSHYAATPEEHAQIRAGLAEYLAVVADTTRTPRRRIGGGG